MYCRKEAGPRSCSMAGTQTDPKTTCVFTEDETYHGGWEERIHRSAGECGLRNVARGESAIPGDDGHTAIFAGPSLRRPHSGADDVWSSHSQGSRTHPGLYSAAPYQGLMEGSDANASDPCGVVMSGRVAISLPVVANSTAFLRAFEGILTGFGEVWEGEKQIKAPDPCVAPDP